MTSGIYDIILSVLTFFYRDRTHYAFQNTHLISHLGHEIKGITQRNNKVFTTKLSLFAHMKLRLFFVPCTDIQFLSMNITGLYQLFRFILAKTK